MLNILLQKKFTILLTLKNIFHIMCTEICFSKIEKLCRTHPDFFSGDMPGRKGAVADYRFAYNGMETDHEVSEQYMGYSMDAIIQGHSGGGYGN